MESKPSKKKRLECEELARGMVEDGGVAHGEL